MRRRIVPAAVLFFIVVAARAQSRGAVDWIFLIDTSEADSFPDLLPPDLAVSGVVRSAYEQVLLCRALGISTANLGATHLAAVKRLAAADAAALRRTISDALAPRLTVAEDVARDLRTLIDGDTLTQIDRGILEMLVKRYDALL